MLEPFIRPITGSVTLGDAKTTHSVSEVVTLKLSFVDDDLEEHRAMKNPAMFRQSKVRPSAQAIVSHSFWTRQSLLMLSGSDPADEAA
eukprot:gene43766-58322_t